MFKIVKLGFAILVSQGLCASVYAACPVANQYNFNFSSQTATSLNYATIYTYTANSTALGNQNFTVQWANNGFNATTTIGTLPEISADVSGALGVNALVIGGVLTTRTANITSNTRTLVTTLTFPVPVRDVTFTLHDLDFLNNQFRDWMHITGVSAAGNYVPAITTPFGQANNTGPFTNASSSAKLGPQAAPVAVTDQQVAGVGASTNNSSTGNITATFAQPVTSVQLRYGNYPLQTGETATGQQFYAVGAVSWCPMPDLGVTKTSAPFVTTAGDPNRFNVPGADVAYSLTVTNSNSSPIDLNATVLTDILPSTVIFRNSDYDDAGPLTTNFEFLAGSSGLTIAAANLTYSNNGGTSYTYSPAAGYDTNVNAVRINPQGTMAANSSFTIRFRTQIK